MFGFQFTTGAKYAGTSPWISQLMLYSLHCFINSPWMAEYGDFGQKPVETTVQHPKRCRSSFRPLNELSSKLFWRASEKLNTFISLFWILFLFDLLSALGTNRYSESNLTPRQLISGALNSCLIYSDCMNSRSLILGGLEILFPHKKLSRTFLRFPPQSQDSEHNFDGNESAQLAFRRKSLPNKMLR